MRKDLGECNTGSIDRKETSFDYEAEGISRFEVNFLETVLAPSGEKGFDGSGVLVAGLNQGHIVGSEFEGAEVDGADTEGERREDPLRVLDRYRHLKRLFGKAIFRQPRP